MAKENGSERGRGLERHSRRGNGLWKDPKARESMGI